MKKILLSLGLIGLGLISFCSASDIFNVVDSFSVGSSNPYTIGSCGGYCCFTSPNTNQTYRSALVLNNDIQLFPTGSINYSFNCFAFTGNFTVSSSISTQVIVRYYDLTSLYSSSSSCDYSDYELKSNITESYCTNKFSTLIDESDITSGYCETEFGLIDPENCPASGGTGDIQRSSFFVNSHQVEGASNIYLYLPDFLNWDYTYLNSGSTLEINVENEGDEDYINSLLAIETYHPSSEDFTQSFTGTITLLMPYIIIVLFVLFIWRLIKRIFK